ncbi:MAG: LytR/AlgR family response regulator transcription factor [Rhodothermales bacterium]
MPNDCPLRVVIADDEPLARQRLEDLLAGQANVNVVGQAETGHDAVEAIRRLDPDLLFLDVQMPGLTGVEVAREVGPEAMPATIFVTAYDQYALKAFDLAALDYLLKPFDDERFDQALARARQTIKLREIDDMRQRLAALLKNEAPTSAPTSAPESAPARYLERVAVEMRGQVRVVSVDQIDFIAASGPYAELHTQDGQHLIRERMQTLEERLDPDQFFRIHRSAIVRLDCIDALLYNAGGDYAVRLKNGKRLKVSRGRREALEQRLGLDALS